MRSSQYDLVSELCTKPIVTVDIFTYTKGLFFMYLETMFFLFTPALDCSWRNRQTSRFGNILCCCESIFDEPCFYLPLSVVFGYQPDPLSLLYVPVWFLFLNKFRIILSAIALFDSPRSWKTAFIKLIIMLRHVNKKVNTKVISFIFCLNIIPFDASFLPGTEHKPRWLIHRFYKLWTIFFILLYCWGLFFVEKTLKSLPHTRAPVCCKRKKTTPLEGRN